MAGILRIVPAVLDLFPGILINTSDSVFGVFSIMDNYLLIPANSALNYFPLLIFEHTKIK
ncbi:hypothetical protein DSL64_28050 [Dyadobacter luteus]|uniref:Uncharacterized protein n=1 Tax=Dyadobacter luteus TaxID=2259619 RepID=A0A3D8Y2X1_9BACT|nr:hypothetical protein DSL64_28050 [Dyadobacter luteus]